MGRYRGVLRLDVFRPMQVEGVRPSHVILVSVLLAISRIGALQLGKWGDRRSISREEWD